MKVILFMAQSLNGFIADENGNEDFLSDENWYTFKRLAEKIGCFIIGRKTYDVVSKWENYSFEDIDAKMIIVSKSREVQSPKEAIETVKRLGFDKVLLTGGSKLNTSFIEQDLIDEIILNVEPAIIGQGINIFAEGKFEKKLDLIETKKLSEGIIQLHYKVKK
ncbi:dihydrofolate reductase family protein [Candidatus Pacearchaeota archaeon]|nr:dihydrofolate reductase family protein [Candidatus Pacearchaeota archaeon]